MPEITPVRILVADDQVDILNALKFLLSDEGYEVTEARSRGKRWSGSRLPTSIWLSWISITRVTRHRVRRAWT